ncbi:MAG TPA: YihY/virulence factor BrkB family protein [Brevundimonas sp.]|jgi:membrane protein|uniref:YihY/virulence factor BrkB family protein n=1 Tax=Brevundimonas sp. TaxID=1871086 RepID=UPI002EDA528C
MRKQSGKQGGLGPMGMVGAVLGGLAAGAGAAHLLHTRGGKAGLDLSPQPAEPAASGALTPEDFDTKEPGRGRLAQRPEHIPHKGWVDIFWRLGMSYFGDRIGFLSGGVTFFVMLSLFPTLAAFVTIYGLFADPADAAARVSFVYSVMPSGVAKFLADEMNRLAANSNTQLTFTLVWTLALSLWTANGAIKVLFYGLNVAYHEVERRNIVRYNLICMAFTVGGLASILITAAVIVGVPLVLGVFGWAAEWSYLAPFRWPVLLLVYGAALTLIYRMGPCRQRARWRWLTPGAIFASLLSLTLSLIFSWYLQTFVRTASYGPLAAMMGFLLWTWLSVQIILMGAELNAEIEHQTAVDTTTGHPLAIGERGAVVADTVGAKRGSPAALAFTLKHAEALSDRLLKRKIRPPRD